jgi:MFS family permease
VYLLVVGCTFLANSLLVLVAYGLWSALPWRALAGIGWAGTYMTGLKLLADQVDEKMMSRAVTGHAASIGISGALSFACADLLASNFGWAYAFTTAGMSAAAAWLLVALWVPRRPARPKSAGAKIFDFGPVFRNRSAMAYSIAYCVHTLEMNALRGWGVAFLGFVAVNTGSETSQLFAPTTVLTALALIGTAASVLGNEAAIRIGRRKLIGVAMISSALFAGGLGFIGSQSYLLAVGLLLIYGFIVWLDSSSLTAGSAGTADPARRGATLAVHSTLGYAGGFVGPLIIGFILDLGGGMTPTSWGLSFLSVGILMLVALAVFWAIRPRELAGDNRAA